MSRPFSERVALDDWRQAAEGWARTELERAGRDVTGSIDQLRIRPWSTQLTIPTDQGRVWLKANCRYLAFEPRLHAELARIAPGAVDAPLAIDDRGWMLTTDRGATMGETEEPTCDDWGRVLRGAADLQRVLAGHEDQMLATGLPDCRPSSVVDRFDRLVEMFTELPEQHPAHVSAELRADLLASRSRVVDAVAVLDESPLPTTWQHGDLHPWNVFASDGAMFDFADGQWAHALELLIVPFGWITQQGKISWEDVLDEYCDVWGVSRADLGSQWRAASLTQPINRTLLWWGCLQEANAAEWTQWSESVLHHLCRVIRP